MCPACNSPQAGDRCAIRGYTYLHCASCGSYRLLDPPAQPEDLYDEGYFDRGEHGGYVSYDADAPLHLQTACRRLEAMGRLFPGRDALLLDVGCASGYVLEAAALR